MLPSWLASRLALVDTDASVPLAERWGRALAYTQAHRLANGHWTAFSIRRDLEPHAQAGTTDINLLFYARTLVATLTGETSEATHDLFFLFGFEPGAARDEDLRQVVVSNRPQAPALGRRPIVWLGHVAESQSIPLLLRLYRRLYPHHPASDIIVAATAHTRPEMMTEVAAVLEEMVFADAHPIRRAGTLDALFHLPFGAGVEALDRLASAHPSHEVRAEAGDLLRQSCPS